MWSNFWLWTLSCDVEPTLIKEFYSLFLFHATLLYNSHEKPREKEIICSNIRIFIILALLCDWLGCNL